MRGYLFNLIVYTHEKRRFDYFDHVVKAFVQKYPCRVISIRSEAAGERDYIETSMESASDLGSNYDLFSIRVSKSLSERIPFLVLPQLIPDLPIYLVWGQNPTSDNKILPVLQKLATRFIFDSECARDLGEFSRGMLDRIAHLQMDFMDVSWAQIGGWREALAQTFQSEKKLHFLEQVDRLVIQYNAITSGLLRHTAVQAIYLQAWLTCQMGWDFESLAYGQSTILSYRCRKRPIEVVLEPQNREALEAGKVFELSFSDKKNNTLILTLAEKQSKINVYFSNAERCELPFSLPITDLSKGLNAMKEIFYNKTGHHYMNMLHMLKQVPWENF